MTALDHDVARRAPASPLATGLLFALVSAIAFGVSGPIASGLLATGWSPGAAVTARVVIAAVVLLPPAALALRGRRHVLRANVGLILAFGLVAVAGVQFGFFMAITTLPVGVALLIEYTAPAAVVVWMWLRHAQRPTGRTVLGALLAGVGLVLVLDLTSGAFAPSGVLWAIGAMACLAGYFVLSAGTDNGLPPIVLAAGGSAVAGLGLLAAGAVGVLPMTVSTQEVLLRGWTLPWWVPVLVLGVVSAAIAYGAGIAANRRLGARLASFVGLSEVVAGVLFAWLLLAEVPAVLQVIGGVLILGGVVLIKLGEPPHAVAAAHPDVVEAPRATLDP